jgi:hypothetical protein
MARFFSLSATTTYCFSDASWPGDARRLIFRELAFLCVQVGDTFPNTGQIHPLPARAGQAGAIE